jgi:hypothetical protein
MPDPTVVSRYVKVRGYFRRGSTEGERQSARNILDRLEAENPGIEQEADRLEAMSQQPKPASAPAASSPKSPFAPFMDFDWGEAAAKAFDAARSFAQKAAAAEEGRQLADEVEDDLKITRNDTVHFVLKFRPEVLHQAKELNPLQREMFVQALHEVLEAHMTELFEAMDQDPD